MIPTRIRNHSFRTAFPGDRKSDRVILGFGIFLFCLLAATLVTAENPKEKPSSGRIQAVISPAVGEACIDGWQCVWSGPDRSGSTSSVRFTDLAPDQYHTLTVTLDGYKPYERQVFVMFGQSTDVRIPLAPLEP